MTKKRDFQLYTIMWITAVVILLALLWQNVGDARIINYSGLVRGATQKLVKEELSGQADDALIARLDGIIYDLQTGEGDYGLTKNPSREFQRQLAQLKLVWESMKTAIPLVRTGQAPTDALYDLSQQHFELADQLVLYAEQNSTGKLARSIAFYFGSLVLLIAGFAIFQKKSQRELEQSVSTDKLTGLLTRAGFETKAAQLLRRHPNAPYVIVEFDIDKFKVINDVFGYPQGDRLLRRLAGAIDRWEGSPHISARINADDFVLLAQQTDDLLPSLQALLERAARQLPHIKSFGGVHFTFGAYRIQSNSELPRTVMDKASTAHKMAKQDAGAAVLWYDDRLLEKLRLETKYTEQMHRGLAQDEFKLYLQPKVALSGLRPVGAEALVRWELPGAGTVYPDSFIPLFEKNGSIAELDFYMLKKVCGYLRQRLDAGAELFTISVNFSRVTLYQPTFYESFIATVDAHQIPRRCVEIEVTESAFNEISDSVLQLLARLQSAGFPISMDDFGAGYSNLNLLSKLPIDIIKLDRDFILELDTNPNSKGIIACAIELAHTMHIKVVCEGVEQAEHVAFLRAAGCDVAQGYYFSRPIPQQAFTQAYPFTAASAAPAARPLPAPAPLA